MFSHQGDPWVQPEIKRVLVNNGCLTEDGTVTHTTQTEMEAPAVSSQLALTYSPTLSVGDSGSPSENGEEAMPFLKSLPDGILMSESPPHWWEHILTHMEPVILSELNQKAFVRKGCRRPTKKVFLEVMEFMTDEDPSQELHGRMLTLPALTDHFCALNRDKGRRFVDICIPPDWAKNGIYSCFIQVNKVLLAMVGCKHTVTCDIALQEEEEITWYFEANYSKSRASLCYNSCNGSGKINCMELFVRMGTCLRSSPSSGESSTCSPGPILKRQLEFSEEKQASESNKQKKVKAVEDGKLSVEDLNQALMGEEGDDQQPKKEESDDQEPKKDESHDQQPKNPTTPSILHQGTQDQDPDDTILDLGQDTVTEDAFAPEPPDA